MEIIEFKIRLSFYDENFGKWIYIDETKNPDKLKGISFEWNWLDVASDDDDPEKEFHENYYKLHHGYSDNDVLMEASYKDGYCCIEILFNTPSDTPVTVFDDYKKRLITRSLFDWIKISINGSLSDGIGENPVAYYDNNLNDVWLSEIITTEKLNDTGQYFYIGEPLRIIDDPKIIETLELPNYKDLYNDLLKDCGKSTDRYKKINELFWESTKYTLNKIKQYG